jgi:hypothetical protein
MVPKPLQQAIYDDYYKAGRPQENHFEAIRVVNVSEGGRASLGLPTGTKALTVWQPWASLIVMGAKPHEFRRWKFTDKPHLARLVGQRVVVHAGSRPPRLSEIDDVLQRIDDGESGLNDERALPLLNELRRYVECKDREAILRLTPLAAAVGSAALGEPRSVIELFKDTIADSERLDEHVYGWPMNDPVQFAQPLPAAGAQGFWNWS